MRFSFGIFKFSVVVAFVSAIAISAFGATAAQTINLPADGNVVVDDDQAPDVTARVARISLLEGSAKVRHSGTEEWETVVLNLPVVEGDEIVTDAGSRLEIQFDRFKYLRLADESYLKVVGLKDEGIALSLPLGTLSVRITSFDKERSFFEIDAPKTTIAVQDEGTYRIDSGKLDDAEVRVTATNGGMARVYSDNAGFLVKSGRSARIYTGGVNAGEWEMADASRSFDGFDSWADERDRVLAKRLDDAYYDKYYDSDIYGAEDLDGYGDWVYASNYGYVWRPHQSSLNRWSDWSPYRYGHWRWIPPYGWTWINDESWGWATYHHGRWFFDNGFWYWSPYGYYRPARSWWYPALVVINVFNNNVCWYPLPYYYTYYNYNCGWRRRCGGGHNNVPHNNPPNYTTGGIKQIHPVQATGGIKQIPPKSVHIPPSSVVAMSMDDLGGTKGIKRAPLSVANTFIDRSPDDVQPPALPAYSPVKASPTIAVKSPKLITSMPTLIKTGAGPRKADVPMDNELRTTKMFNGRQPTIDGGGMSGTGGTKPILAGPQPPRQTGAIIRQPSVKQSTAGDPPVKNAPVFAPPVKQAPIKQYPIRQPNVQADEPVRQPTYSPPVRQPIIRSNPPPVKQPPRSMPTVRDDPPPVKHSPPPKSPPVKQPSVINRKAAQDG
ncbi:MAG: FecR domain-containing protein [Chloracidobacterium sp.]|nr:FecR domain-containing protein [Chloracidobacterium sp.]